MKGLVFVQISPADKVPLEEFHSWYDEEHAPARRTVPGMLSASRYVAIDNQKPEWLAVYELEDVSVLRSPAYEELAATASEREKGLMSKLETMDRRVYELFSEKVSPAHASASNQIFRFLGLQPGPQLSEEDYNRWYEEEHVPLLSVVPGWLKSTRWKLKDATVKIDGRVAEKKISRYLAIHEWESLDAFATPEFKHAVSTPWRDEIMPEIDKVVDERRNFKPHKRIF